RPDQRAARRRARPGRPAQPHHTGCPAQPQHAGGCPMTAVGDSAKPTLMRAAVVTVVVTLSGSLLGLVRDLLLAGFFGADGGTDAFLVAWTVPETAFTLVVEGAMSFLMTPLFSRSLEQSRQVVASTLPRVALVLVGLSGTVALGAPVLVHFFAPGLAD